MNKNPKCKLIGTDGNVFALVSKAAKCLERAKMQDKADELRSKLFECKSYDEALSLISSYVEVY